MISLLKCLNFASVFTYNKRLITLGSRLRIIYHDADNKVFLFNIEYGENAEIHYEPRTDVVNVIDLKHTFVPKNHRGKGIAQLMAEETFEFIEKNQVQVTITCPFLNEYIKLNPQFKKLLFKFPEKI